MRYLLIAFLLIPISTFPQIKNTQEAHILIEQYKSNYSNKNLNLLRNVYKKHLKSANFSIGKVKRNIPFGEHPLQKLDIHYDQSLKEKSPVIIFIHGGAFVRGDKSDYEIFDNVLNYFARNGFTGINANYRLAPEYKWPSGAEDIASIIQWIKTHHEAHNLDSNNIFLMGHSAGAAHVATYSFNEEIQVNSGDDGLNGAILLSGVYKNSSEESKKNYYGYSQNNMPIENIDGRKIPMFIIDAEYDKLNTQLESIILIKELCRIHDKCPHHKQIPLHNHYSMMYHFNTLDNSIAEDILVFMRNNIK